MKKYSPVILFAITFLSINIALSAYVLKYNKVFRYKVDAIGLAIMVDNKAWESSLVEDKNAEMWHKDLDVLHGIISRIIFYYIMSTYAIILASCYLIFITCRRVSSPKNGTDLN